MLIIFYYKSIYDFPHFADDCADQVHYQPDVLEMSNSGLSNSGLLNRVMYSAHPPYLATEVFTGQTRRRPGHCGLKS